MTSPIADGVMAATYKLVQQAMSGQWQDVPKTVEERRVLLERLSSSASPQDQQWLGALQQAMAESDAAVAKMTGEGIGTRGLGLGTEQPALAQPGIDNEVESTVAVDQLIQMITGSR